MNKVVEVLKNFNGLIGAIAAVPESHFSLFAINPAIHNCRLELCFQEIFNGDD